MRLALTTLGCPNWPVERVFSEAARMGYEGVEFRCLHGKPIGPDMTAADREAIRVHSRATGLPVVAIGASSAFSSPDPAARAEQERDLAGMLDLAAEVGAPMVRAYGGGFPRGTPKEEVARNFGGGFAPGQDEDAVCAWIAESVDRVARRAQELGLLIVLETHDGLSSAKRMAKVLGLCRHPAVQGLWDTLHPTRLGESPAEVWDLIGPRVRHVHFKDGRRDATGRWRAAIDGEGEVPLRECLAVLDRHGYAGWVTLEWEKYWEPEIAEPEEALPRKLEIVRGWLADLAAGR